MNKTAYLRKISINLILILSLVLGLFIYSQSKYSEELDSTSLAAGALDLGMMPNLDIDIASPFTTKSEIINSNSGNKRNEIYKYAGDGSAATMPNIEFGSSSAQGSSRNENGIEKIDWIPEGESADYYRKILENATTTDDGSFHYNKRLYGSLNSVSGYYFVSNSGSVDCQNLPSRQNFVPTTSGMSVLSPGNPNQVNYRFARGKVRNIFSANGNVAAIVEGRIFYDNVCTFRYNESGVQNVQNFGGCSTQNGQAASASNERPVNLSFPISVAVIYRNSAPDENKWITAQVSHLMYKSAVIDIGNRTDLIVWGFNGNSSLDTQIKIVQLGGTTDSQACSGTSLIGRDVEGEWTYDKPFGGTEGRANILGISNIFGARSYYTNSLRLISNSALRLRASESFSTREPIYYSNGKLYITFTGYQTTPTDGSNLGFSYIISLASATDVSNILYTNTYRYLRWQQVNGEWQNQCFEYGGGDAQMIERRSSTQRCILAPRDSLGVAAPKIVPLLANGSTNRRLEFNNGTFLEKADNPVINRTVPISEIKDPNYLSYNLYANYMAGSYFTQDSTQKNIIGIADNGIEGSTSIYRFIWIGGENIKRKPVLNSFSASCDESSVGNPFKLKFSIVSEGRGSQVYLNSLRITPFNITGTPASDIEHRYNSVNFGHRLANGNSPETISYYNFDANNGSFIDQTGSVKSLYALEKNPNYRSSVAGIPAQPMAAEILYSIINSSLGVNGNLTTLNFIVEFNKNNQYYQQFYKSGGFNLYFFMQDTNNNSDYVEKKFAFDPISECAGLYYKTSNGDFRTNESGTYRGQTLSDGYEVDYGSSESLKGNKIWKNNSTNYKKYKAFANPEKPLNAVIAAALQFPDVSEFSFESINTTNVKCDTTQSISSADPKGFCFNISQSDGFTLDDAVSYIQANKDKIKENFETLKLDSTVSPTLNNWFSIDSSQELITIYLDKLPQASTKDNFYIEINDIIFSNKIYKVQIVDSENTPDNVIVHCLQESCIMRIKNLSQTNSTSNIVNDYKTSLKNSFTNLAKDKTRLYLNFGTINDKYIPSSGNVSSPFIQSSRKVILETTNTSEANYYLGGIITSGFVYTSISTKTDIIKGFILSRGISARNTNSGNSNLYFNDFPNPVLFVDYDPKFLVKFRGIFSKPPQDVKRTYIGFGS